MKKTLIIVVGPSGAGKSSFVDKSVSELSYLVDIVTFTTRSMRASESEGDPYHFVDRSRFEQLVEEDFFVEWAEVHNNLYGSPKYQISDAWDQDKVAIMDIDVQGARAIKDKYPESLTIFISPPSVDELRRRVSKRDDGKTKNLELRMSNAIKEMDLAETFDCQLVNDKFDSSYAEFKKMIEEFLKSN